MMRNYLYIDKMAVERLYNQKYEDLLNVSIQQTTNCTHNANGTIGVSGIPLVSGAGAYTFDKGNEFRIEKTINVSVEKKLGRLTQSIGDENVSYLGSIIKENSPFNSRIINAKAAFVLTHCYDEENGKIISAFDASENFCKMKKISYILSAGDIQNALSHGNCSLTDLRESDSSTLYEEYGYTDYIAEMNMGGDNMLLALRHLTYAMRLGAIFRLSFFANLTYLGDRYYSIKPYAVWNTP
jgi:hypothetical protein